ncbi:MAG: hypothetical protein WCH01_05600 [Methylococcaceae bacterium]
MRNTNSKAKNTNLISKNFEPMLNTYRRRRSGRDCRNQEAKDGVM